VLRSSAALATALVALAATGCGSSTNTTTPGTTTAATSPPTRAQFIAQADAICQQAQSELAPLKARVEALKGSSPSTYKVAASLVRENVAISRAVQKKLDALAKPPADAATIEKMLGVLSEEITDKNNAANAIANEEAAGVTAASAADKKAKSFDEGLAQGYGMKVCGRSE
jgi:hypothetical protein